MSDITLAVDDGARRMTYTELAQARGISLPAARRLALRHHWLRQMGNDGLVRVSVPLSALSKTRKSAANNGPTSGTGSSANGPLSDTVPDITRTLQALESAVEVLREQLTIANQRADRERERAEQAEQRVAELLTDQRSQPAPVRRFWWPWRRG